MTDGERPTLRPGSAQPIEADSPRVSNVALTERERRELLASIDRQIAELDRRRSAGGSTRG